MSRYGNRDQTMTAANEREGVLLLEDGSVFHGHLASPGRRCGEVVFNTAMTGYQEVLTDPSYRGQIVVMTQPHIGNYGVYPEAEESDRPWVEGFVAREFTKVPSGRGDGSLIDYLRRHDLPALEGIDTRAVVRRLRVDGAMRGVIAPATVALEDLRREVDAFPRMAGRALVDEVTCARPYEVAPAGAERFRVAVYDYGVKRNIVRSLVALGARVHVLPARTPAATCLDLGVDGVVLSNGPGDPEPLHEIQGVVRDLIEAELPVFGICLGHQLLGLAVGGRTYKLKFGHHGGNQPVRDVATGAVSITSQNHGFAIDPESLPGDCRVTTINLNDGTVEGLRSLGRPVFSVQYHPEAAPGPHDASRLFVDFVDALRERRAWAPGP